MFDDLRQQADDASFDKEDDEFAPDSYTRMPESHFLGMTPQQRFVIAVMLLMMVCVLGAFCLLATEKVVF
jgi:hypothetical protein